MSELEFSETYRRRFWAVGASGRTYTVTYLAGSRRRWVAGASAAGDNLFSWSGDLHSRAEAEAWAREVERASQK
jgi:hypothetical protein